MSEFKHGDQIRVAVGKGCGNDPPVGKEFTVDYVNGSGTRPLVYTLQSPRKGWYADRFELVPQAQQYGGVLGGLGLGAPEAVAGRKDDTGKLDVTLLFDDMPHALEAVTEVLQWAITKKQPVPYERGSWQNVPDFQQRYRAAQLRHMLDAAKASITGHVDSTHTRDAETGLLQLAHIATDALFQLEMAVRDIKENGSA